MFQRLIALCLVLALVGCGGSDKASSSSTDTSKVSQKDLDAARSKMHLNKDLQIEPKGYAVRKFTADVSGTFFKFIAKTDKIEKVFARDMDLSKFHNNFFLMDSPHDAWFDVRGKEFPGGNAKLPDGGEISVGYVDNKDGTLTVYVQM